MSFIATEMGTNGNVRGINAPELMVSNIQRPLRKLPTGVVVASAILSSISPTCMRYAKMRKCSSYHCMHCLWSRSPLYGGKKQNAQMHCMELNLSGKDIRGRPKRWETPEVNINFILLCLHFQIKPNSRWPVLQLTASSLRFGVITIFKAILYLRIGLNRYFFTLFYAFAQFQNTVKAPWLCVSIPFSVIYTFNLKIFVKSFRNRVGFPRGFLAQIS